MEFKAKLTEAILVRRYKRFLADVEISGQGIVTAHCPNPGSMLSLIDAETSGQRVWVSYSADPRRKLAWTLELLEVGSVPVCVNTQHPNRVVEEAVRAGRIKELAEYETIRREVRYGENSRIDLLLQSTGREDCYVEIKSATMSRKPGLIEFPDSVTKRGQKHMLELAEMARTGARTVVFFLSPRPDGERFRPATDIDPAYSDALQSARNTGVELLCYSCAVSPCGLYPAAPVPVSID